MKINTKDARYILLNRIQCMRSVNELLDEKIDFLVERRAICCGYYSGSSSSSSSPLICEGRVVVFQICNENSVIDDNFNIYINDVLIGLVDLNANAQIGAVFIGSLDPALNIIAPDFICPIEDMDVFRFDGAILNLGTNTIRMENAQLNGNGNFGSVGIRLYELSGNDLINPIVVDDLQYSGTDGDSFTLPFEFNCGAGLETFFVLAEDNSLTLTEDGFFELTEEA